MKNADDNANGIGTMPISRIFDNKKLVVNSRILKVLIKIAIAKTQNMNKVAPD